MRFTLSLALLALGSPFAIAQYAQPAPPSLPARPLPEDQSAEPAPPIHIALRVVGSQVRNSRGDRLGRIEEILLNRTNGAVEYAVLAPSFPTNQSRLVPVPWSRLTYAWDQSRAGGPAGANQIFIADIHPAQLAKAPTLDRNRTTGMDPVGGTGAGSGVVTGSGASQPAAAQPTGVGGTTVAAPGVVDGAADFANQRQPVYFVPGGATGFFVTTNGVPTNAIPTNAAPTNGVGTPSPGATNPVTFQPGLHPPFTPFPGPTPPPGNVVTNTGPSGPSAGGAPPIRRSQGVPQTPVRESSQPSTPPSSSSGAGTAPSGAPGR